MSRAKGRDRLEETEIHDVLRNDRRRLTIDCLQDAADGTLSVRELSERVAVLETGDDPPPRNKRQSVYVSLHQTHLPKLDDLDIVTYDGDSKTVRLSDRIEDVRVFMEVVPRYGLSWGEYYVGLALLGLLVTLAGVLGVPGVVSIPPAALTGALSLAFLVSATCHVRTQQGGWPFSRLL